MPDKINNNSDAWYHLPVLNKLNSTTLYMCVTNIIIHVYTTLIQIVNEPTDATLIYIAFRFQAMKIKLRIKFCLLNIMEYFDRYILLFTSTL